MRILITGSKGFVGRRLVYTLTKKGHEVLEFKGDIRIFDNVKKQTKDCEIVYHLAAVLDETLSEKEIFDVNVKGTENLLEACAKENIKQFIFLSSVGVYGDISKIADEKTSFKPKTNYEKSKAKAEEIIQTYQELIPITILRSALVYGTNRYWRNIISTVKKGFPMIGNGENKWQLIYIKDLISALIFVLDNENTLGETFIVAEKSPTKLKEIYKIIKKELNISGEIKTIPIWFAKIISYFFLLKTMITGEKSIILPQHIDRLIRRREYDIKKIEHIGWKPRYEIKAGLKETIQKIERK